MKDMSTRSGAIISRRTFLAGVGGTVALSAAGSLIGASVARAADTLLEAPQLAALVKDGKLPEVGKRLPPKPVVVQPVDGIGQYGGTWTTATTGAGDAAWWWRTAGYEGLMSINVKTGRAVGNVAQSIEVQDQGKTYVFHLVPGIKWSDGQPFSAHDIAFWYNDFAINKDVSPAGAPFWMRTASGAGTVEAIDDNTVVFRFKEPNGFLPNRLASADGVPVTAMPKHYLSQFHKGYNKDVDSLAKSSGANSWSDLFLNKAGQATLFITAGLPVIHGWSMQTVLGKGSQLVFERNPYYWKVDPNGSQLPYIDRIVFEMIADPQVMLLKGANGELSYHLRGINSPANKPVLARAAKEHGFSLVNMEPSTMNEGVLAFNLTHNDPVKRKIFNNQDFRIAMSYATDRQEIINAVYQRQGKPWQASPLPTSKYHNEKLATQYVEHDIAKANDMLDQAGYKNRNSSGTRLGPDGKPIHIHFLASTTGGAQEALLIDVEQILKQQWAKVGIEMDSTSMERSLFITRTQNEDQDALMWTGFGGHDLTVPIDPRWYLPIAYNQCNFAAKWALWFNSNGETGEEPPAETKKQFKLYRDAMATPDDNEREDLMRQIIQIAQEQFYVFGTTISLPTYAVKVDTFHNVPKDQPDCWPYPSPGQVHSEQFWIGKA